ncbi:cytochrome c oxidase assembly protein Cox14p [Trichomonascus vanleenenianus]|uniref:Cox14p n=1 Tax=Trichomonascus vanleenenianus TaxID=2268995 RepID=UPI003EC9ADF5
MMYRRPWYVKVADAAHRLTVLGIIGFSVYLAGGIGMTLWANRSSVREAREKQLLLENEGAAAAAAPASTNENSQ